MKIQLYLLCICVAVFCISPGCCQSKQRGKTKRRGKYALIQSLEKNVSALWHQVEILSNPVHVHVHDVLGGVSEFTAHSHREEEEDEEGGHGGEEGGDGKMATEMRPMDGEDHSHRGMREDMEKEMDGSEEESSEEDSSEEDHEQGGGTHVHIHLNMGGPSMSHKHEKPRHVHADYAYPENEYLYAKCDVIRNNALSTPHNVGGTIYLRQKPSQDLEVKMNLYGFNVREISANPDHPRHTHGIHVHQFGDFSNGCNSFGGHFNPSGTTHGGPHHEQRHAGDWGNIKCDHRGIVIHSFTDKHSSLTGPHSILGRGIVIHERADDHGEGGSEASRASGDAGRRIACCVVTWYNGGAW